MISKRSINLMKICRRSVISKGVTSFKRNQRILSSSIFTSGVNPGKKLTASEALKLKNEFLLDDKEKFEDTFGTIDNFELRYERVKDDPEDVEEYKRKKSAPGKSVSTYIKEIQEHLKNNEYEKAVKVLEIDMVNDSKPAITYIYRVLISYNGMQGNLKEAYRLYTNLKKRKNNVGGAVYTSLFNACANCKNSYLALEKAAAIREYLMNDKNHTANISNYNAMLKAYGRHGDLNSCFKIVDEVLEKRNKIKSDTYSFLLQACISDKNSGLRHALITWRKMLQNRVKPTVFEFNLILRCARDCSFGETELMNDFVKQIESESGKFFNRKVKFTKDGKQTMVKIPVENERALQSLLVNQNEENLQNEKNDCNIAENDLERVKSQHSENLLQLKSNKNESNLISDEAEELQCNSVYNSSKASFNLGLPNLLSVTPSIGFVIGFGTMTKSYERFLCFGGVKGFLKTMSDFGASPNLKTFTLLLDLVSFDEKAEKEIMKEALAHNIKLDTGFFNVIIKRRNFRKDEMSIQKTLKEMQLANVSPDIITFGEMAQICRTHESGIELIEVVRKFGIRLNSDILEALLMQALKKSDLNYAKTILQAAKEDETHLSPKFTILLTKLVKKVKHLRKIEREQLENIEQTSSDTVSALNVTAHV